MSFEINIHSIQAQVLMALLFKRKARFSELNSDKIPTDHFTFHLKQLVNQALVKKIGNGKYCLTNQGKEFANRFDTERAKFEKQAKIGVVVCGVKLANGVRKYLVQQRLKQPFYGYYGFVSGKIRFGETVSETAVREFQEETGLTGQFSLTGIEHKMDFSEKGELLEDKFFFIFRVKKPLGKLVKSFAGGRNQWLAKKEIEKLDKRFGDVMAIIKVLEQRKFTFWENKFIVSGF
ncbi:MAG TPA: NUDIX domain-containing protein [Candidatus Bathyarchaeia archaeon]|nr:NUDIX domain-containing protein [Candidatus Bathyarchaeia archaeon]